MVGFGAGFLSGLFGIGGGVLIVPGLVFLVRFDQRLAHGTSLAAIAPISAAAVVGYWLDHQVFWEAALLMVTGSVVGAYAGTHWLQRLPIRALEIGFGIVLVIAAVRLFLSHTPGLPHDLTILSGLGLVAVGLVAGVVAGLMGVGGGIVSVPALIILFAFADSVAKGTSLAVILPTSVVGTVRNMMHGNADLRVAAVVGVGGVISAFAASRVAVDLNPRLSQALFGGLLLIIAARTLKGSRSG